jgi:hypothetical protein
MALHIIMFMSGISNKGGLMFYIIVILTAIFAMPVKAQSLRDQVVGAWSFVSCNPNNLGLAPTCGTNPNGIIIYDASGRYASVVALRGRPKASGNRTSTPAEELGTLARGLNANFGTWSINETDKTITAHVDGALFPNVEGAEGPPTPISVSGDELRIGGVDGQSVFRRIKR